MTTRRHSFHVLFIVAIACACLVIMAGLPRTVRGSAPLGRYSLAADVVTDNVTSLRWQRKVTVIDQDVVSAKLVCQSLSLGGYSTGWRLPTVKELQSLVDVRSTPLTLDSALELDSNGRVVFVSATAVAGKSSVWTVEFGMGRTAAGTTGAVRCVHD